MRSCKRSHISTESNFLFVGQLKFIVYSLPPTQTVDNMTNVLFDVTGLDANSNAILNVDPPLEVTVKYEYIIIIFAKFSKRSFQSVPRRRVNMVERVC